MCSECSEDDGPVCIYCGTYCYGHCEDPDTCQTCWRAAYSPNMSEDEEDFTGQCVDDFCRCKCHDDIYEKVGIRFEAGAIFCDQDVVPVYERKGIFPFLALAGEIREKIYGYAMLQDGKQRSCANHRGAIHTALLRTCRQVYSEARHVPLTINRLCFSSPLHAHDFFGFTLAPSVRQLVTGLHVEYHMLEFTANTWTLLLRQLAKMSITHLGLTLKGRYPNDAILGHTCFSNRFLVLTGLKSLDLVLATAMISHEVKQHIQEEIKTRLIKSYIPKPELEKSPNALTSKRTATSDDEHMTIKPAKRAKKESENTKSKQAPKHILRRSLRSHDPENGAVQEIRDRAKTALLLQYDRLVQYATALDTEASLVRIRLQCAREAAEASNEAEFERLFSGVWKTLEEHYDKITTARMNVRRFAATPVDAKSVEATAVGIKQGVKGFIYEEIQQETEESKMSMDSSDSQ